MKAEILAELNDDQKQPVLDYEGPSFIVAGPGSGKTHTVISRTRFMILNGVSPESIMLFTFTNKAAKEIKARIIKKIGERGSKITVGTYHSVCTRLLRQYADLIGRTKKFTIFDTDDSYSVLKKLVKGMNFDHKQAMEYISDKKSKMIGPTMALQQEQGEYFRRMAAIYQQYQNELEKQDAFDFDDLIFYTIIMLERNPEVKATLNSRYRYITADEFHDSSPRDIRLIELLGGDRQNVCMILDDEQSIYRFRGADLEAVLAVQNIFPGLKTFVLQQNYRSTQSIVAASRSLISNNEGQLPKTIFTENEQGTKPIFFAEENQAMEGVRVQKLIQLLTNSKYGLKYKDIAILYRMSYLSRAMEDQLLRASIPYRIVGGTPFYARKEVKDILCFARLAYNPFDFEAFKRVVNIPKRGIGEATIEKIFEHARNVLSRPISFVQACKTLEIKGKAGKGLADFVKVMDKLIQCYETDSAGEFVRRIIDMTGYDSYILEEETAATKAEERLANMEELVSLAASFDSLEEFLQSTSLDSQIDEEGEEDDNKVNMQTLHSSKGLEYKAVIIIGCNETITPHWKAMDPKSLEEERRLFYVGMTRAEKYLFLTRPKVVMKMNRPERMGESRFIRDIDPSLIERYSNSRRG